MEEVEDYIAGGGQDSSQRHSTVFQEELFPSYLDQFSRNGVW